MRFWRAFYYGFKIALGVMTKLQDQGVVTIKELPKIDAVVKAIEEAAEEAKRR